MAQIYLATCRFSIRAPVMGATLAHHPVATGGVVSIRAPVMGATSRLWCPSVSTSCFDPRPRDGGERLEMPHEPHQ